MVSTLIRVSLVLLRLLLGLFEFEEVFLDCVKMLDAFVSVLKLDAGCPPAPRDERSCS